MKAQKPIPELPPVIAAYWAASNAGKSVETAACFATDAEARDEGHTHRGRAAIQAWMDETHRKYQAQAEPLRAETTGERTVATARVSGNFPGSPIELDYAFTVRAGHITQIAIQ
ncbi:nuclear transport factor 2 family protein [Oleiharenicola lentus]|uniref:nuclear transport factor 2 family protein n=1 Tax=Oleiharenicola lentus TaxID=2508720 RepID=UPI003F67949F